MSDFNDIKKYLSIAAGRQATEAEAAAAPIPFDKYYSKKKAKAIAKVPVIIKIPALARINGMTKTDFFVSFEYQIDGLKDFYIKSYTLLPNTVAAINWFPVIRWNDNGTIYRYILYPLIQQNAVWRRFAQDVINAPYYSNQKIGRYCVLEFWNVYGFGKTYIEHPGIDIVTSILGIPDDGDQTEIENNEVELKSTEIKFDIDADLPIDITTEYYKLNT